MELTQLNVQNINVKVMFGFDPTPQDQTTIAAIPVGYEPDDPVLPDIHTSRHQELNWREVFIIEILRKCNIKLLSLYNPEIAGATVKIAGETIYTMYACACECMGDYTMA